MLFSSVQAQDTKSWEDFFDRMGQLEDAESGSWEITYDELSQWAANKTDLNRCSREDLLRLPFLSEQQVMDIIEYRDMARRIETPMELRLIPSLEKRDIDLLMQFVEIGPALSGDTIPSLKNVLRYGRHEAVGTVKLPFYRRKADENGYLGYPYKHWLRYTYSYRQQLKAGVVASQDAGEPFFAGRNAMGYDFYSAFVLLRDMGRIKSLALGRYRLRFGMGLIMNNSMGLGKLNTLSMLGRSGNNMFAHSSRSEGNYLQGAAATVRLNEALTATGFASWRKIDATLNDDDASVATLLSSGYHRTKSEMERRRNTSQLLLGGNVNYFSRGFHAGITGYRVSFNRALRPDVSQHYRRWYPSGKDFWNLSVDYGYVSHRLTLSGETATGSRGAVATINSLSYRVHSQLSLMALQRFYPYQFCTIFGESFAEGGAVNNESGVYLGAQWSPLRGMNVLVYVDGAYFAWPKYGASMSSHCLDNLLQLSYERGKWDFGMRYRMKMRERDNAEKTALTYKYEHRGRLTAGFDDGRWTVKTQADLSHCNFLTKSLGYMLTEKAEYRWDGMRLMAMVGYFNTDDYNSRVYVYDPGVLYNFSFPSYFGEGLRVGVVARKEWKNLMMIAKLGSTCYFDRNTMGSGLQEVKGRNMTDLELQMRMRL